VTCLTVSCSQSNANTIDDISVEEATALLNQSIQYASDHNLDGLCGMGGAVAMCQHLFENAGGWDAVPDEAPEIIDSYMLPQKDLGNGTYEVGGRILVVKGVDGLGNPYQTDFFVFMNSETGELAALYPIYWGNFSIVETDDEGRGVVPNWLDD